MKKTMMLAFMIMLLLASPTFAAEEIELKDVALEEPIFTTMMIESVGCSVPGYEGEGSESSETSETSPVIEPLPTIELPAIEETDSQEGSVLNDEEEGSEDSNSTEYSTEIDPLPTIELTVIEEMDSIDESVSEEGSAPDEINTDENQDQSNVEETPTKDKPMVGGENPEDCISKPVYDENKSIECVEGEECIQPYYRTTMNDVDPEPLMMESNLDSNMESENTVSEDLSTETDINLEMAASSAEMEDSVDTKAMQVTAMPKTGEGGSASSNITFVTFALLLAFAGVVYYRKRYLKQQ